MNKTNLSAYMAMTVSQLKEEQRMGTAHGYGACVSKYVESYQGFYGAGLHQF